MTIVFNLLLFLSLPLLLSTTSLPPPSTTNASQILKLHRGYSLSAAYLATSSGSAAWNGTGTILALPDVAFSALRRPSLSLLLSHTLKQRLTWLDLTTAGAAQELPTWQSSHCLLLSKGSNNEVTIRNSISAVKIIHPDIYVDDHLTVHGIDSVLDPSFIPECSFSDPTMETQSLTVRSTFLDRASWFLRRKGFGVVAAALNAKKTHLLKLPAVTIFATSDNSLFSEHICYDFLRHVAPKRYRLDNVTGLTAIDSLSPGKMITIGSDDLLEIYHNRWIVVIEIAHRLDDAGKFYGGGQGKDVAGSFSLAPSGKTGGESPSPVAVGVYGEEDESEEWRQPPSLATEEKLCKPEGYLSCPARVKGSNDYVAKSEPFVSEKLVQSAPSHQMNKARETVAEFEPLDESVTRQLSEGSKVDNAQCKLSSSHLMNNACEQAIELKTLDEGVTRLVSEESTVDIARRRLDSLQSGESGVARNKEGDHIVQLADDFFYYT